MNNRSPVRLTQFARAGGCGCKASSSFLSALLKGVSLPPDPPTLIAGLRQYDDAGVMLLDTGQALILTADFFTPILDDPFQYGQVAAANAVSDVYAMGGRPILAQALLGWPTADLAVEIAGEVVAGAVELCASIGVLFSGGHTIDAVEPLFGLCVNGVAPAANIKRNSGARVGDVIYLTKPLGSGVVSTAEKKGVLTAEDRSVALLAMAKPNSIGAELGAFPFVNAMTDVTGFGLAGHLFEMCSAAGISAEVHGDRLKVLQGFERYVGLGCQTGGSARNIASFGDAITCPGEYSSLVFDPQTNGGLLIACAPDSEASLSASLVRWGLQTHSIPIGHFVANSTNGMSQVVVL